MNTKQYLTIGLAGAAILAAYGASDRLDVYDKAGKFVSIMVDDISEITVGKSADGNGYSTFNVVTPAGTNTLNISDAAEIIYSPVIPEKAHDIFIKSGEHTLICLLDWRNNTDIYGVAQIDPTKPFDWRGCWADGNPHFLVDTDKGYVSEFAITGTYTGKVYSNNPNFVFWSTKDNNLLGMDSYSFDMPFEPIEISTRAYELDTYADAPFLGEYKGIAIRPETNRIAHKAPAVMSVAFDANTTYTLKTTDSNAFDVFDIYKWDEEKNTVSYIPYEGEMRNPMDIKIWYGITGKFYEGNLLFATIHNIVEDKPDNNVRYIASKDDVDFTVATADEYERYILVQVKPKNGSAARYFYYDDIATYPAEVTMQWISGNNIGENSVAYCVDANGERIFKYDYKGAGNSPVFTFRGKEYGTYTGSRGNLTLDGFGKCTLGSDSGSYTIDGGVVNVEIGNETITLAIDNTSRTYSTTSSNKWDGQQTYTLTTATGAYMNGEQNTNNYMYISFDTDLRGNPLPGSASVVFEVARTDGFSAKITVTQDIGTYIYDAASKTVVITDLYMGTSATTSGRRNLTMKISDDKCSMWVDDSEESRLYSTSRDGSYLLTGKVNTLTAPRPATPTLAAQYSGKPTIQAFGNAHEVDVADLTIDTDASKATLVINAMGASLVDAKVDYTFEDNTLTLHGIPSCKDTSSVNPTTEPTDIVFVMDNEGKLKAQQNINAVVYGSVIEINMLDTTFNPAN